MTEINDNEKLQMLRFIVGRLQDSKSFPHDLKDFLVDKWSFQFD